jgi:Flp pilus assembly protein TadG
MSNARKAKIPFAMTSPIATRAAAPCPRARRRGFLAFLGRMRRDQRGTSAIEFAIIGPLFLLLIFAILENAIILWSQAVLDNATRDAARLTLTGQSQSGGTAFQTALCNGISALMKCSNLQYRVQTGSSFAGMSPSITYNSGSAVGFSNYPASVNGGSPGSYVLVQVIYNRPFIVPWVGALMSSNGKTQILSTAVFENEPY